MIETAPETPEPSPPSSPNPAAPANPSDTPPASSSTSAPSADRGSTPIAIVTATVIERGTLFEGETQVRQTNDTLRVRYELEQREDRWYVRDWQAEAGN